MDTERDPLTTACEAVAHALRPRPARVVAKHLAEPTPDDVATVLRTRIAEKSDAKRTLPFWEASGYDLTAALMDLREIDESLASHLIGAALQAQISAGEDLHSHKVLELAEAALVWLDGAAKVPVTA